MEDKKLILYDLRSAETKCWSPNLWKVRLALRYKGIPFETVWLTYPDIKPTIGQHCQQGEEAPTLPTIQHGDVWVYDSWSIIQYLEKTFPSTPSLLYPNLETNHFFLTFYTQLLWASARPKLLPLSAEILDVRGKEYFVRTRRARFGMSLEEMGRGRSVLDWKKELDVVVKQITSTGKYIFGHQLSYADILVLSLLLWMVKVDPGLVEQTLEMYTGKEGEAFRGWYERVRVIAKEDL
ncbi:hypothetical protein DACRYDRAFT_24949 [Dacryopinax primogenitus]|uniref:GST N-terminal domain-containing protein n=1 Tax=Dacryopinax primogenitus (strain DJM 731) TaxID=1858805 RepID=M5FNJ5_DACPD|nr:uncharacterized protein DACRYDRAFT_24949 [Dacryopinax primogenitus]EJT97555.1 hypothetical protein DACRYDRAFT_24949 [Dacryopinax primogenitus]